MIKVAIIGCGYWGPNLVRNFRNLPECEVACVIDLNESFSRRIGATYSIPVATSMNGALALCDAVVIATPAKTHYEIAAQALTAGKHVLVEKPMAMNSEECRELNHLAARQNLTLMVGHTFLYAPAVQKLKTLIDDGVLGDIHYLNCRRVNFGLFRKDHSVIWDLSPHDISIAMNLLGESPERVVCTGSAHVTKGVADMVSLHLSFPSGRTALIHNSWLDPRKVREVTVVGSKKMAVYDDTSQLGKIKVYDTWLEVPPPNAVAAFTYHNGDIHIPNIPKDEPLYRECEHFLECITTGKKPRSGGGNGLAVVSVMEAAERSLKNNSRAEKISC